jgi:hypothetical protein
MINYPAPAVQPTDPLKNEVFNPSMDPIPINPTQVNTGGVTPDGAAPQATPVKMPPKAEDVSAWEGFLGKLGSDKNMQKSLLMAGAQMMQPRTAGQTNAGMIGKGLQTGLQTYEAGQKHDAALASSAARDANLGASTANMGASQASTEQATETAGLTQDATVRAATSGALTAESQAKISQANEAVAEVASSGAQDIHDEGINKVRAQIRLIDAQTKASGNSGAKPGATQQLINETARHLKALGNYANTPEGEAEAFREAQQIVNTSKGDSKKAFIQKLLISSDAANYPNSKKREELIAVINELADKNFPDKEVPPSPEKTAMVEALMKEKGITRAAASAAYDRIAAKKGAQ